MEGRIPLNLERWVTSPQIAYGVIILVVDQ